MVCLSSDLTKANPANFELTFPLIPGQSLLGASEELVLNITSTILPSITIPPLESQWQNTKRWIAGGPTEFEQMNIQFVVDGHFANWKLLYNWMMYISNNKDKMLTNYHDYVVDASLRIINNFGGDIMGIKYIGMWPTNLQEVSFSMKEGEVLIEGGATFVYDYFEVLQYI